jgi:hypothetical protein
MKGSVDYLAHDVRTSFFDIVRKYLDKFLIEVLNGTLLDTINGRNISVMPKINITI